eukprot:scaffold123602_cov17-Tisochrysis_lutea.AAC.1
MPMPTGKGSAAVVRPLSIRQLPINAKQRFERLFAFKPQWEATELEPYLHGLQLFAFKPVWETTELELYPHALGIISLQQ